MPSPCPRGPLLAAGTLLAALALASLPGSARAQLFGPDYTACGKQASTLSIVNCVSARTKYWDERLNAAYAALGRTVEPQQGPLLRDAERLWIQFRDSNCRFYGAQSGTIAGIKAAECVRAMTEARARELEDAAKP